MLNLCFKNFNKQPILLFFLVKKTTKKSAIHHTKFYFVYKCHTHNKLSSAVMSGIILLDDLLNDFQMRIRF